METVTNGRGKGKYKADTYPPKTTIAAKKMENKFKLDEKMSHEEKIEKCKEIIGQLKLAATEISNKLQETKYEQSDAENHLRNLYWKCGMYDSQYKKEEIRTTLQKLDEYHVAEMQQKRLLFEENKMIHKIKHGRNSLAEEMRIQRETKCFADERNKENNTLTVAEIKMRIPWSLKEKIESKESIPDIKQVLYDELLKSGKKKISYNKEARRFQKKIEAVEKEIDALWRKLEDINCKQNKVHAYLLQLKNPTKS